MIATGGGLVANKFVSPPPYAAATAKMANVIIRISEPVWNRIVGKTAKLAAGQGNSSVEPTDQRQTVNSAR